MFLIRTVLFRASSDWGAPVDLCHYQIRILFPLYFVVFKQTTCHLTAEANVEQVFSRVGQLSEVNLDPDTLTDMVSIMVNNLDHKPSVKDIMDKYYEMFRGRNHTNKTDFFNRTEDSDSDAWTRLRSWVLSEEESSVCERETSLSFIKITQSLIY